MNRNETPDLRGRWWLPALLLAAYALLNLGGWWYYRNTEASIVDAVGQRLLRSTQSIAGRLDDFLLEAWRDPFLDDSLSRRYTDRVIAAAEESPDFEALNIYDTTGVEWRIALDDSLGVPAAAVAAAGAAFDSALFGTPFVSPLYASRGEYFLAACAPVYDFDSQVTAVAIGEAGKDYFTSLRELRSGLLLLDAFAGILFLAIGLIFSGVQRRLARAEQAAMRSAQLAAMGQMVATVAHELKNPLGIIKNSAERIRTKYGTEGEPLFDFIPEEVDRLDQLLRRYLQFARLEVAATEPVELLPLAAKLEDQMPAAGDSVSLLVRVPAGLSVTADPAALRQVLLNVLLNAFEACGRAHGGEVSLSADSRGQVVEIVVTDTGVGMDTQTLRRAQEPFFTTRTDGSGLGVYLAQTLMERMNGRMTIKSRVGEGTSVTIALPAGPSE
jgi:signal transduction histidine kinase